MVNESQMLVSTRKRDVWTKAEHKTLRRAAQIANLHKVSLPMCCGLLTCPDRTIVVAKQTSGYKGRVLRCGCTDRVVEDTF